MAIELATAYVSLVPETTKLEAGVKAAFSNVGKDADKAGQDIGNRLAKTASKAMRDGWRPDKDIMDGIPDTKLDRVGARIGQVIGKGVAANLKAHEAGQKFTNAFTDGATSVGFGKLFSTWKSQLTGGNALATLGATAGKTLMAGITGAATLGAGALVGGIGVAITKGFDRLMTIDKAKFKLKGLGKSTSEVADIVKTVTDSVTGTPFSLDQAFGTAVMAIGAGAKDIKRFMQDVVDAAGFAGTDVERMGLIFTQVLAKGKLTGEEMMQLMEAGLPAKSWIMQSYKLTTQQFDDMQKKGEITLDMLQKSIEDHAPGMAKALGNSLEGSIDKMKTAVARLGANFLVTIFGGDSTEATENMADAVQKVTDKLNDMDGWVKSNGPQIRETFSKIGEGIGAAFKAGSSAIETFMSDIRLLAGGLAQIVGAMARTNEMLDKVPGMGDLSNEANSLRQLQDQLNGFANPGMQVQQGGAPNASRERRGLPPVSGSNEGLKPNAISLKDSIASMFPAVRDIGGYRPNDPFPDHPSGRALDVMIPPELVGTPEGKALGDKINQFALSSGLAQYTMWEQKQFNAGGGVTPMEDRSHMGAGVTQNHFDHVHIYTNMGAPEVLKGSVPGMGPVSGGSPTGSDLLKRLSGVGTYDTGGWLPNGTQLVTNNTGKPELILNPDQQKQLADQGIDPNSLLHGTSQGAQPGPSGEQPTNYGMDFIRSMGFVPAAAGSSGVAGTSSLAGVLDMGASVVGGLIDTGVNLGNMAVSAAIGAAAASGSFGAGAAAAPAAQMAASYGLQLLGNQGKTIANYWFGLAGIGADAAMEVFSPFGMPRWLGYDYTKFAPQLGIQEAALSTIEQMGGDAISKAFPQPGQTASLPASGAAAPTEPIVAPPLNGDVTNTEPSGPGPTPDQPPPLIPGLFDQGGILPPGGIGINLTSRPEPVLTSQQWDAMMSNPPANTQSAPLVQNLYAQDMQDAIRQLEKVKRRDMMQYSGRP